MGIANTLVGFSIIFGLMFIGISPITSNAIGTGLSYYLNSKYTFASTSINFKQALKFFTALGLAYLMNLFTLQVLLELLNPYLAQFISAIVYTVSSFVFMKLFVFQEV